VRRDSEREREREDSEERGTRRGERREKARSLYSPERPTRANKDHEAS